MSKHLTEKINSWNWKEWYEEKPDNDSIILVILSYTAYPKLLYYKNNCLYDIDFVKNYYTKTRDKGIFKECVQRKFPSRSVFYWSYVTNSNPHVVKKEKKVIKNRFDNMIID